MSDLDTPPSAAQLAYIGTQVTNLLDMGALVYMGEDPLPPGLIGTLSQVLPDGPMNVVVDATEPLYHQLTMLLLALEWLVIEPPDAQWQIVDHVIDGRVVQQRSISMRVE